MPYNLTGYFCFHYRRYAKPPPLCFAQQNIGEVAQSDGGVNSMDISKNTGSNGEKVKHRPLPCHVP